MSEAVQIELVKSLTIVIPAFLLSSGTILSAIFAYRASVHAKVAAEQSVKTEENTNHLKDELVASVKEAAFQAGIKQEKENS